MWEQPTDDLVRVVLGRAPRGPATAPAAWCTGARVLITGASGRLGVALADAVRALDPAALVLLDLAERPGLDGGRGRFVRADVRDHYRLVETIARARPDVVVHAAGHGRAAAMEARPAAAIVTNTLGTQHVLDASRSAGASRFVLVSGTDAAAPASALGAAQLLAEVLAREAADAGMRTAAVRIGQVLGPRGSITARWATRLQHGLPLEVGHRDEERHLITLGEAVALILDAVSVGGAGDVLALDTGAPVRMLDLARRMAEFGGRSPARIVFTGMPAGEPVSSTYASSGERVVPTGRGGIVRVRPAPDAVTPADMSEVLAAAAYGDDARVRRALAAIGLGPHVSDQDVPRIPQQSGPRVVPTPSTH